MYQLNRHMRGDQKNNELAPLLQRSAKTTIIAAGRQRGRRRWAG